MNDDNSNDIQSADQFTALCERLLDRDLSYSDRESLLSEVKSLRYQISFEVTRKRNCYSSGPDDLYRDGIILEGKIADLEAAVRVSFKSEDKPSLEDAEEGDIVSAVVLPERWSSGLKEWECWATELVTEAVAEEDPVVIPAETTDTPTDDTHEDRIANDATHGDSESAAEAEPAESEEVGDTEEPSETETDDTEAEAPSPELPDASDAISEAAEETVESVAISETLNPEDALDTTNETAVEPPTPPADDASEAAQPAKVKGLTSEQFEDLIDDEIDEFEETDTYSSLSSHVIKETEVMTGCGGCLAIIYWFTDLTILVNVKPPPVVMLLMLLPHLLVLAKCLAYRRNYAALGIEHGYTTKEDQAAKGFIIGIVISVLIHLVCAVAMAIDPGLLAVIGYWSA